MTRTAEIAALSTGNAPSERKGKGGEDDAADGQKADRRTQGERSAAMKHRLIEATLSTLADHGYADLTLGLVVQRAGVSRGAPLHHFASKSALVEAAATELIGDLKDTIARLWRAARGTRDPMRAFCLGLWHEVFRTREGVMLAELSLASRRSPELAEILSRLWTEAYRVINEMEPEGQPDALPNAPPRPQAGAAVGRMMMLSQWLMRGMASDVHLGAPEGLFEAYLESWVKLLSADRAVQERGQ